MASKLNNVSPNLMVNDVDSTLNFYTQDLGFTEVMTMPEKKPYTWAMIQKDEITFMLQQKSSLAEEYPLLENREIGGSLSLFINVENIDEYYSQLKGKDTVQFLKPLGLTSYGMQEFAIADNNGYVLTFAER